MSCDRMEELLPDYALDRLPGASNNEVEAHVEGCEPCRAFLGGIRELYAIPLPFGGTPPSELQVALRGARRSRQLMLLFALAAAILLYFKLPRGEFAGESLPRPTPAQSLRASLALTIDLPELPEAREGAGWIDSELQARLLSEYSGKPVLLQYINAECTRCLGVVKLMDDPKHEFLLDEFICFRSEVQQDAPPTVLAGRVPDGTLMHSLPAMFVRGQRLTTDPLMAVANWDDVKRVMEDFAANCESQGIELKGALAGEAFDAALERMYGLPSLMEAGSYNQVLAELERMAALDTRFGTEAERMIAELMHELEGMLSELESRAGEGDGAGVQSMAQDLLPGLTDTPFARRLQVLCE